MIHDVRKRSSRPGRRNAGVPRCSEFLRKLRQVGEAFTVGVNNILGVYAPPLQRKPGNWSVQKRLLQLYRMLKLFKAFAKNCILCILRKKRCGSRDPGPNGCNMGIAIRDFPIAKQHGDSEGIPYRGLRMKLEHGSRMRT